MARFMMRCQASKGEATRVGYWKGEASVNSWYKGMVVSVVRGDTHDQDVFTLRITGGSNGGSHDVVLLTLTSAQIEKIQQMGNVRDISMGMLDGGVSLKELYLTEYNKTVECGLNKPRRREWDETNE